MEPLKSNIEKTTNKDLVNSKQKIVLIFPHKVIQNFFWNNSNIIFLCHDGWWLMTKNDERVFRKVGEINKIRNINFDYSVTEILSKIRSWSAVISRWYDDGDQFDLKIREILYKSFLIASDLSLLEVKSALFHTGVSHHIDNYICENACSLLNISQIFLYTEGFTGRLLPLIQRKNISDRSSLNKKISSYNYSDSIKALLDLKQKNIKKSGDKVLRRQESFFYSILYIFIYRITSNTFNFYRRRFHNKSSIFDLYYQYSLSTEIKQILQQRKAIKFYDNNLSSDKDINRDKKLLIVAHYQPEATSFPEGGEFTNHLDIVLELRAKGFEGEIYYKEHPGTKGYLGKGIGHTRVGMARSKEYYMQLLELGCKFLPMDYYLSVSKSDFLPITITGTIAIERSLVGLKTIVTGEPWWKGLPGTIKLSKIKSLKNIDKSLVDFNNDISNESFAFLKNILDNKTITNAVGIGTGIVMDNKKQFNKFEKEYEKLVSYLLKNN